MNQKYTSSAASSRDSLPNDVDGLLQVFFRAETPSPWPAWRAPAAIEPVPRHGWRGVRSRVALLAALLLLWLGHLCVTRMNVDMPSTSGDHSGRMEATHHKHAPAQDQGAPK